MPVRWEHSSTHLTREPGAVTVPHPSTLRTWEESDDRTEWPAVTAEKMFSYYSGMAAAGGNDDAVRNAEAAFAYPRFHGDKVGPLLTHKRGSFVYLEASVGSIVQANDSWHSAWVLLAEKGDVETAGCSCVVAGQGPSGCVHAAAILWTVEDAVRRSAASKIKCGVQRATGGDAGIRFKVKRHKRKTVHKPLSASIRSARPAGGVVTHYASHEDWRRSRLLTTMAPFYACIGHSLLSAHFHSVRSSAESEHAMESH